MNDQDEMDAWLAEVELANEQIRKLAKGEISLEKFNEKTKKIEEYKQREALAEIQRQETAKRREIEGREGKGSRENYKSFCKNCFREYTLLTPMCFRCGKETMTCQERIQELKNKLISYKSEKLKKEERKYKWEMWKKTKSMFWNKNQTDYSKWDYFTSSEDEGEGETKEPILPKDDPNFKALELDMEMRVAKRKKDRKIADEFKEAGNKLLSEGKFKEAIGKYSEGLEVCRDYKALYTNRALAYLKFGKPKKAIEDCSKLLQYVEVFEKDKLESKDLVYKAFIRRAKARLELKQFEEAILDTKEALALEKSNEAQELLKVILEAQKCFNVKANNSDLEKINSLWNHSEFTRVQAYELVSLLRKVPESKPVFLNEIGGLEKLLESTKTKKGIFTVIQGILDSNEFFLKTFEEKELLFETTRLLHAKTSCKSICEQELDEILEIEECLDFLAFLCQNLNFRNLLLSDKNWFLIVEEEFSEIFSMWGTLPTVFASFCSATGNSLFNSNNGNFRSLVEKNILENFDHISSCFSSKKIKNLDFTQSKISLCNLLTNLLTAKDFRMQILSKPMIFESISAYFKAYTKCIQKNYSWTTPVDSVAGVFQNLVFDNSEIEPKSDFFSTLLPYFDLDFKTEKIQPIYSKIVAALSKMNLSSSQMQICFEKFTEAIPFLKKSCINFFARNLMTLKGKTVFKDNLQKLHCKRLNELVRDELKLALTSTTTNESFHNLTILAGLLSELSPENLPLFKEILESLIAVVRDSTGPTRKSAAILLAKLCKNSDNLEKMRELHGMDVLKSVASFL